MRIRVAGAAGMAALVWVALAQRPPNRPGSPGGLIKPRMSDTIKASIYVDNWFMMYINGKLVAVDPIDFIPHNEITIDLLCRNIR